jgi:hypothetical protein
MRSSQHAAAPVELRPLSARGPGAWMRALFRRRAPRARMVAPRQVALGSPLTVEWGVDCPAANVTAVRVTLTGHEVSRQRLSARTGIHVISAASTFAVLEIARLTPPPSQPVVFGRGTVTVPERTITTFAGAYNEIAWAVIVEAELQDAPPLRESFPIVVVPRAPT